MSVRTHRPTMSSPSDGQRRLLYGLLAIAAVLFSLGILVVWLFAYGPLR